MANIREWYEAWLREREAQQDTKEYVSDAPQQVYPDLFPSEIVDWLRNQALECENSERNPRTGVSTWPKESTVEWAAADLIQAYKSEIDQYEIMRETFINLWRDMADGLKLMGFNDVDYRDDDE